MPGFVPANFNLVGKIIIMISSTLIAIRLVGYFMGLNLVSNVLIFFAVGLMVIGLYLVFVVPKE